MYTNVKSGVFTNKLGNYIFDHLCWTVTWWLSGYSTGFCPLVLDAILPVRLFQILP